VNGTRAVGAVLLGAGIFASQVAIASSGRVFDRTTGKPLPNAVVVATWTGTSGLVVQSHTSCYKAEVTRTDNEGAFSISSFTGNLDPLLRDRQRDVVAVARGYRMSPKRDPHGLEIPMEPQTGSNSERLSALPTMYPATCPNSKTSLVPYVKALYDDASPLASTNDEKLFVLGLLMQIEEAEIGSDEAIKRFGRRQAEILRGTK
jgi:hypothetical protein